LEPFKTPGIPGKTIVRVKLNRNPTVYRTGGNVKWKKISKKEKEGVEVLHMG